MSDVSWDELGRLATVHHLDRCLGELIDSMQRILEAVQRRDLPRLLSRETVLHDRFGYAEAALCDAESLGINVSWSTARLVVSVAKGLKLAVGDVRLMTPEAAMERWPIIDLTGTRMDELRGMASDLRSYAEAAVGARIDETDDGEIVLSRLPEASTTTVPAREPPVKSDTPKRPKRRGRKNSGMQKKTEKQYQKWDDMARNGMSHEEIASECGVERGTVSSGIKRLRDKDPHR